MGIELRFRGCLARKFTLPRHLGERDGDLIWRMPSTIVQDWTTEFDWEAR